MEHNAKYSSSRKHEDFSPWVYLVNLVFFLYNFYGIILIFNLHFIDVIPLIFFFNKTEKNPLKLTIKKKIFSFMLNYK